MSDTAKSFWQTAPGVITAVAALITALGGVVGILFQNGVFGSGSNSQTSTATSSGVATTGGGVDGGVVQSEGTAQQTAASSDLVPWAQATARLVRQDGTDTTVKASTVGLACDTQNIALNNGQHISLQLVGSIRFQAVYPESHTADAVVKFLDGRQLADSLNTRNCPVSGSNEYGPVQIELVDLRRIDFDR